ncbi:MAG: amino acid ABC transporter permease [Acidimicrobiales bacterium]
MSDSASRRALHERARRRRSLLVSALSSAAVMVAVVLLVPRMPRWDRVRASFFDGERFRDSLPRLLEAFWLDVRIFLWSVPFIVLIALLVAVTRNSGSPVLFPLRILAVAYTDIMRGVPVILWIYLIGFGVPGLGLDRPWNSPLIWGSVALILTYASYVSEVFRAGIESVHESQRAAARSLGLNNGQTMRFVVLPQAVRRVVPPLMNDMVSLQKDVALVSLIGPIEILRQAGVDKAKFASFTPYVAAALVFLAVTVPLTRLTDWLLARERGRTTGTRVR